jgi:hypothetical protein
MSYWNSVILEGLVLVVRGIYVASQLVSFVLVIHHFLFIEYGLLKCKQISYYKRSPQPLDHSQRTICGDYTRGHFQFAACGEYTF